MDEDGGAATLAWTTGGGLRSVSRWFDEVEAEDPRPPLDPLDGDTTADVVVVGAGLTGLWTAYALLEADPALNVLLVEAAVAGHGASGRTGGWCSAGDEAAATALAAAHGPAAAREVRAALRDAVVEVGAVAAAEQIDCDFAVGGRLTVARTAAQLARLTAAAAAAPAWGDELDLLTPAQVAEHTGAAGVLGGTWTPDAARVQPVRLVRGLADVVTARGARLVEDTRALRVSPGALVTDQGTVRARWVVVAAPGVGAPAAAGPVVHALATEPLPAPVLRSVGLDRGRTLADAGHRPVHVVRTPDDRLVVSGTGGTPRLRAALTGLLPATRHAAVTHAWSGPVDAPAAGAGGLPSVGLDADGVAWAQGLGAEGVTAANLAGRALADLLTDAGTELTRLPWAARRPVRPSAARRLAGVATGVRAALADREERLTRRPSRLAAGPR